MPNLVIWLILEFGFNKNSTDSSMFVKLTKISTTIISVYVDDLIIIESDKNEIRLTKLHLKE